MTPISSFRDVVALWDTPAAMAADIGAGIWAARKWPQRDFIPSEWWAPIVESGVGRAHGLTIELMAGLASRRAAAPPSCEGVQP